MPGESTPGHDKKITAYRLTTPKAKNAPTGPIRIGSLAPGWPPTDLEVGRAMTNAATDEYWADAIGLTDDDRHEVEPKTFAKVHPHKDGSATLDEGWGGAWIETETVVSLEEWR